MNLQSEINKRRTFAIISHPDAGKTTLTEKLLLYGGAVQLAGSVTARKNQRATTSDWMELEKKRGISVSSTVLQFEYGGHRLNLLDTPGHRDFSEDTYRVLTAVDAVVMVIDAGKGIESQTRKLFEVCRRREIPIFTFINKLDRPAREPLALMDELESILQIHAFPMNWPLGMGADFKGVFDRLASRVHLFERTTGGAFRAPVSIGNLADPLIRQRLDNDLFHKVNEELEMLELAGAEFDPASVHAGLTTPVFFGSAMNNFGVQLMLDGFLRLAPSPLPRRSQRRLVSPGEEPFSGFIFKIQANMDPRHRDRIAFLRVCSGRFRRDMTATHLPSGKRVRLSNSHKLFAQERETVDEAYAGDIVGLVGHSEFGIGDTLTEDPTVLYKEIPRFPRNASRFSTIRTRASSNNSGRAWSNCCRKASSRCSICGMPRKRSRSWPRWARFNSRSCNTASRVNTEPSRAWNKPHGRTCDGCRSTGRKKSWRHSPCQQAVAWLGTCRLSLSCCSRTNGRSVISPRPIATLNFPNCHQSFLCLKRRTTERVPFGRAMRRAAPVHTAKK